MDNSVIILLSVGALLLIYQLYFRNDDEDELDHRGRVKNRKKRNRLKTG